MQRLETQITPAPNGGLRAASAVARDRGISDVTLWRWRTRGWIQTVNISGKIYVDLASLADFDRRACTGEFSKAPTGAAGKEQPSQGPEGGAMTSFGCATTNRIASQVVFAPLFMPSLTGEHVYPRYNESFQPFAKEALAIIRDCRTPASVVQGTVDVL